MLEQQGAGFKPSQNIPDQMHQPKSQRHDQDGTDYPAFSDENEFWKIDLSANRQTDTDHAPHNGLGGWGGNPEKRGEGNKKAWTDQRNADSQIVQVGFDDPLADSVHDMMALEHGTKNRK